MFEGCKISQCRDRCATSLWPVVVDKFVAKASETITADGIQLWNDEVLRGQQFHLAAFDLELLTSQLRPPSQRLLHEDFPVVDDLGFVRFL